MTDAFKFISGLDAAIFGIMLIVFRSVFSRFVKLESKITELSEIQSQLKLIHYRLGDIDKMLNKITIIQVKKDAPKEN